MSISSYIGGYHVYAFIYWWLPCPYCHCREGSTLERWRGYIASKSPSKAISTLEKNCHENNCHVGKLTFGNPLQDSGVVGGYHVHVIHIVIVTVLLLLYHRPLPAPWVSVQGSFFGVWCLVFGVWCLVFGDWRLVFVDWCLVLGVWCCVCCLAFGVWCLVFGFWCLVFGVWYLVLSVWCLVFGVSYMVLGVQGLGFRTVEFNPFIKSRLASRN